MASHEIHGEEKSRALILPNLSRKTGQTNVLSLWQTQTHIPLSPQILETMVKQNLTNYIWSQVSLEVIFNKTNLFASLNMTRIGRKSSKKYYIVNSCYIFKHLPKIYSCEQTTLYFADINLIPFDFTQDGSVLISIKFHICFCFSNDKNTFKPDEWKLWSPSLPNMLGLPGHPSSEKMSQIILSDPCSNQLWPWLWQWGGGGQGPAGLPRDQLTYFLHLWFYLSVCRRWTQ